MFDTIILLTSPIERPIFMTVLSEHNPCLTLIPVETLADLNALERGTLSRARLIAYVTSVIVPEHVLDQLGYGAYNFHPGPPTYPGWAPAHFALYEDATDFGATAHAMVARVDEGPIVGVEMFSIPRSASVASLEGLAYARLSYLFWKLAKSLATSSEPLERLRVEWSGKKRTRRGYAEICDIPLDIPTDELNRRIKVFGGGHFGMAPTIHLHGVEFRAVSPVLQHG
ncbi:MAG: methionyl-tRNA formyltransferase [Proteobacteria bacterium]|nr:methionyl-tRNA formyltransferase [Pseudomonadota bacterium]